MSAQIIYGVVFGKPKTEETVLTVENLRAAERDALIEWCKPDVFYMSPPVQLPCDSEPA